MVCGLIYGCGPDKKEQQQQAQARQDSLEQVRKRQQRMQQRQDSIAAARADSIAAAQKKEKSTFQNGSATGNYAVQVGAWRSKRKAQQLASTWQKRGFDGAFVVKYGTKSTGNIWFRVRLGDAFTQQEANKLQKWLTDKYQKKSWASYLN